MSQRRSIQYIIAVLIPLVSCTKSIQYDEKLLNSYKDSVDYKKIIIMQPAIFTSILFKNKFRNYFEIYADSLEGEKGLSLNKVKSSFCTPSKNDLIACEYLFKITVSNYNKGNIDSIYRIKSLNKYIRQYVAYKDRNNDLLVFINCYCSKSKDFYNCFYLETMCDGGPCHFTVKLNLTKMKLIRLSVNGYA